MKQQTEQSSAVIEAQELKPLPNPENSNVIKYLAGIAILCVVVSALVIFFPPESVESPRDILTITFGPVGTIIGVMAVFLKS